MENSDMVMNFRMDSAARVLMSLAGSSLDTADVANDTPVLVLQSAECVDQPMDYVEHQESCVLEDQVQDESPMVTSRTQAEPGDMYGVRNRRLDIYDIPKVTYIISPLDTGELEESDTAKSTVSGVCAVGTLNTNCYQAPLQTQELSVCDTEQVTPHVQVPQASVESSTPMIKQDYNLLYQSASQTIEEANIPCAGRLGPPDQPGGSEDERREMEKILDKTWTTSYLDYNDKLKDDNSDNDISDDDDNGDWDDRDSDPDYTKSPEEGEEEGEVEEDSAESEDSDFIPGSKRKRKISAKKLYKGKRTAINPKKLNTGRNRAIQEKINQLRLAQREDEIMLAKRMAEIEYLLKEIETGKVDKDLSYMRVLLAKDAILRDDSYHWKETKNMVKRLIDSEKNERELKEVVRNVLKRHILLPTSFGPGTSLATAVSYAQLLCPDRKEMQNTSDKSIPSCQLSFKLKETLVTGSGDQSTNQEVPVLSCRTFLLLQQIAQHETNRRKAVSDSMSRNLMPIKTQEGKTILESVLKSMLTVPKVTEPVVKELIPRSNSALLRSMLMAELVPLNYPSTLPGNGPSKGMTDIDDQSLESSYAASTDINPGYSVYVDNAHSEEQRNEPDRDIERTQPKMCLEYVHPEHDISAFKIKSEPLSPNAECSSGGMRSNTSISSNVSKAHDLELSTLSVRIKSEPSCNSFESQNDSISDWIQKDCSSPTSRPIEAQSDPIIHEGATDVSSHVCTPVSDGDKYSSRDSALQMPSNNTYVSNLRSLLTRPSNDLVLKTTDPLVRTSRQHRETPSQGDVYLTSKPGRPRTKDTLSAKIARVKERLQNDHLDGAGYDGNSNSSNSTSSPSSSTSTVKLILSNVVSQNEVCVSKTNPDSKNSTILRCLMNGSSSFPTEMPSAAHTYNTRQKKHDNNLLQEVLNSFRPTERGTSSPATMPAPQSNVNVNQHEFGRTIKTEQPDEMSSSALHSNVVVDVSDKQHYQGSSITMATVKTEDTYISSEAVKQSSEIQDGSDSASHVGLIQNVTSCSQQLLNIIKSVGASKNTSGSPEGVGIPLPGLGDKGENVTILKSMLNSNVPVYCGNRSGNSEEGSAASAHLSNVEKMTSPSPANVICPRNNATGHLEASNTVVPGSSRCLGYNIDNNNSTCTIDRYTSSSPNLDHELNVKVTARCKTDMDMGRGTAGNTIRETMYSGGPSAINSGEPSSAAIDHGDVSSVLGVYPYQCRLCGSTFKVTHALENHMLEHLGTKPFGCNICPNSYMTVTELGKHTAVHITELSPALVYKCTVCGEVFDTEFEHNQHRRTHTLAHQKEFKCGQCGDIFGMSKLLADHLCLKRASINYECQKCTKKFLIQSEYEYHVRKCRIASLIPCSECETSFVSRAQLKYHCMKNHGHLGIKCVYCDMAFRFQIHLDKHMLKDHKERFLPQTTSLLGAPSGGLPGQGGTDNMNTSDS